MTATRRKYERWIHTKYLFHSISYIEISKMPQYKLGKIREYFELH